MDETNAPATTIFVDVDLSSMEAAISSLSSDIQDLKQSVESAAEVQESILIEANDLSKASVNSTDSAAVAILIFIGIILSFSITLWLFRK